MIHLQDIHYDGIPDALKQNNNWVGWEAKPRDNGKINKIPVSPVTGEYAKVSDATTWGTFDEAVTYAQNHNLDGIGYVFSRDDTFFGVDIDGCVTGDGTICVSWADNIVHRLDTYTEISPSGNGLHIIARGTIPGPGIKNGSIEFYGSGRFFTVTGKTINGNNVIQPRQKELEELYLTYKKSSPENQYHDTQEKPFKAGNDKFCSLVVGDCSDYPSQSEADLAFCQMLVTFTGGDPNEIDRLFRQSGLCREKWDRPISSGGPTYGATTIEKAMQTSFASYVIPNAKTLPEAMSFKLTDLGNAERMTKMFGDDIRYRHQVNCWYIWNGTCWESDIQRAIQRKAKKVIRSIDDEVAKENDSAQRKLLRRHAEKSESESRIRAMVKLTQAEPGISIMPEDLDKDSCLLTCLNGTIDLRTGDLLPHSRNHLITKTAPVEYDPAAECPVWDSFLDRIMSSNQNLISFLQKAIGYSLTGITSEQCLFILYGRGANGKSTFLQAISTMLGAHAMQTPTETLLVKRKGAIPNDVARLKGSRLVTASEAETNQRLAEGLIKQMTGQDTISARFLHQEWFDFSPTHKIFLATNHKPVINGTDDAIWRRIKLIPFEVTIPEQERDKKLLAKLENEISGILSWAVRGCLDWVENGLGDPYEVRAATQEYKCEMDVMAQFINEYCIVTPDSIVTSKDLYHAFVTWCEETGDEVLSQRAFGILLKEKGFKNRRIKGSRCWEGIGLVSVGQ